MIQMLDHIVILVDELTRAIQDYTALGFQVQPGGEHSDGNTHNALVSFADGSYLELIAFQRAAPGHTWWRHTAAGPGLIDYALLPGDTGADVAAARRRGLAIVGPLPGGRNRPDGVRLEWQTARPDNAALPFLCGDLTPRELRVPAGAAWAHPNGVSGIAAVLIVVADLAAAAADYAALLGQPGALSEGRHSFQLGSASLSLCDARMGGAAAARLAARGPGICALTLRGPIDLSFDPARCQGAQITAVSASG